MSLIVLPRIKYCFAIFVLHLFIPLVSYASDYVGISTSHFAFYFHCQDERLIRPLIDQAEGLRREIVEDLGIDFEERTKVFLAPSSRKFREIQPRGEISSWRWMPSPSLLTR